MCAKKRSEDYAKEKHLVIVFIAVLIWSAIDARDYFSWTMLTIPVILYAGTLIVTHKKFRFTYFTYVLVLIHIVILLIGAKYTYTHNPLFEEVKEIFNISRNHYDRVGHLAQGFVPAIIAREFLLRKGYFKKSKFFYVTIFAFVLATSAAWELLEFFAVVISNLPARYVLSLQGDYLDTQKDMLLAFVGAALALVTLGKIHDKKIRYISEE